MSVISLQPYERHYQEAVVLGSRLLFTDRTIEAISIENRIAAEFWFTDTAWCVKENPWFEGYLQRGPLIFLRRQTSGRRYLLAPADSEFRNARNRRMSLRHFVKQHPNIGNVLRSLGIHWHPVGIDGALADRIYYILPRRSSYLLARQMRSSVKEQLSK
jgi:hypothetical protein